MANSKDFVPLRKKSNKWTISWTQQKLKKIQDSINKKQANQRFYQWTLAQMVWFESRQWKFDWIVD